MVANSRLLLLTSVAAVAMTSMAGSAMAGPSGGQVVGGSASISQIGNKTDIHQNSDKAILNWQSFDIAPAEHVEFHQPSSSAMALNRIKDTKASQIDGKLTANGHIMLINPNGIVFGSGAQVDVGSLTASTADIENDDFMAGKLDFKHAGNPDAAIINHGSITIKEAGLANFVAPRVENHGVITAKLGKVQLAAGDTFTLDMAGDGLLRVEVTEEDAKKLVKNTGRISAEDGIVALTAARARNIVDSIVETDGIIEANSMTQQGGKIFLGGATTKVSGTLSANGKTGGGEILIGGDYQGKGDRIENAKMVDITSTAQISANATEQGDGGKVIVWADENTRFAGSIEAHGGIEGGNGGLIETSGKINLAIESGSSVDASALHEEGANGFWLLDPSNVIITDGGANSIPGTGGTVNPGSDSYVIDAASISTALNNGNDVTITTSSGGVTEAGTIGLSNATILKNVNNNDVTLTLMAHQGIYIENSSITSTENALNVVLNGDMDGSGQGDVIVVGTTIDTNGGYFVAGGGSGALGGINGILGDGDGTGADDNYAYSHNAISGVTYGVGIAATSITTSGGDLFINGYGDEASNSFGVILQEDSHIDTGDGNIQINAVSTGDGSTHAFALADFGSGAATLTTDGGDIIIDATANAGYGITLYETTSITTTDGDINLTGASTVLADIYATGPSPSHTISSANGDVTLRVNDGDILAIDSISAGDTLNIYTNTPSLTIGVGDNGAGGITLLQSVWDIFDAGNKIVIGEAGVQTGDMDIDTLDLSNTTYDVEFYANDITIGAVIMGGGSILAHAQDDGGGTGTLTVNNTITRTSDGNASLDLRADLDINVNSSATITANDANSDGDGDPSTDTDSLNVILNADRDGDEEGKISIANTSITTNGGYFVAGGGSGDIGGANGTLGDGDGTGADDSFAYAVGTGYGVSFANVTVTTSGGDAIIHGYSKGAGTSQGVVLYNASISSDDGRISLTGTTTGDTNSPRGIALWGPSGSNLSSTGGDIELIATSSDEVALRLVNDTNITTEDGNITITATVSSATDVSASGDVTITSANGNITINADDIDIDGIDKISAGDTLNIFTIDPTTTIGLGTGSTGALNLNDGEQALLSAGNKIVIGKDEVQTGDMDVDFWNLAGEAFDLELYANDINIAGLTMGTGDILAHAQDNGVDTGILTVDGNIDRDEAGTSTLNLRADQDVMIDTANIISTTGSINVFLNADRDGDHDGRIRVDTATITTLGGDFVAGGGSGDVGGTNGILGDGDGTGADDTFAYAVGSSQGVGLVSSDITTSGGDIIVHGYGDGGSTDGVSVYRTDLSSGDGWISVTGTATGTSSSPNGVFMWGASSDPAEITSTGGNIDITATSINGSAFYNWSKSTIRSVDGNITLTASSTNDEDIELTSSTHIITSTNGNVTLKLDDGQLDEYTSISAGNILSIYTYTPTTSIGINGGAGDLDLNSNVLSILNPGNKLVIGENGVQTGDMDVDLWNLAGEAFDLELYANDIFMGGITMGTGNILAHAQDNGVDTGILTVDGNIDRDEAGTSTLDLRADKEIIISSANIESTTGAINVILNADRDADEDGSIAINAATITTNGGYFIAGGGSGDVGGVDAILGNGDGTGADDTAAFSYSSGDAVYVNTSNITTNGGDIFLTGNSRGAGSADGMKLYNTTLDSGDGDIHLSGTSTGGSTTPKGIALQSDGITATTLTSTGGDITILANATNDGALALNEYTSINTTDGNITITATSPLADISVYGTTPSHIISSANGNVTINLDDIAIQNMTSIYAGDTLSIFTIDPTTTIGIGGGTGDLNLNTTELAILSAGNKIIIGEDGVQTGDMDVDFWNLAGEAFDLELYANDINIAGLTMGTGDILAHAQDNGVDTGILTVDGNIDRDEAGTSTLNLRADQDVMIDTANIISTTGSIDLIVNSDRDADEAGKILIWGSTINTLGGDFVAGGGSGDVGGTNGILGDGDGTGADDIAAFSDGDGHAFEIGESLLSTSGGDIIVHGNAKGAGASRGVTIYAAELNSGNGWISLTGTSTGDTNNPKAIDMVGDGAGTAAIVTSTGGNIDITASSPVANAGIIFWEDAEISTTDGDITITSYAPTDNDFWAGGSGAETQEITSANGNITFNIDNAYFNNLSSISAGDTLSIFTIDPTTTIGLAGGAGTLNIDAIALSKMSAGNTFIIGKDGVQTGDMDTDLWNLSGTAFDLELYANDIYLGGFNMGTGDILVHAQDNGGDAGDLIVEENIDRDKTGTSTLDLRADHDLEINIADIESSTGAIDVILNADRDADEDGAIYILTSMITTNGGYFVAGGGSGDVGGIDGVLGNGDGTGADDAFAYAITSGHGVDIISSQITTSGGDAIIHGNAKGAGAEHALILNQSFISTDDGRISLTGTTTGDTSFPSGVFFIGSDATAAKLITTGGNIDITGTSSNSTGVNSWEHSSIKTTDGNITITGNAASGADIAAGGTTPVHEISSTNGNITFNLNDADLDNYASITAGNTLSIFTNDPTTTIGLGDGSTGVLNLNNDELTILSAGNKIVIGKDGIQTGDMDIDAWNLSTTSFDLELYSTDISLGGIDMGEGSILAHAQDNGGDKGVINFSGNITREADGTATLDLRADHNFFINSYSITATDADSDNDGDPTTDRDSLNVILNADRDGDEDGYINILNSTISTNGGYFVAGGGNGDIGGGDGILGNGDGTGADDIAAVAIGSGDGIKLYDSSITSSGGDVILKGYAKGAGTDDGIDVSTSEIISGNGRIILTGTSTGDSASSAMGIAVSGRGISTYTFSSESGDIELTSTSTNHYGLYLHSDTNISTVDGNITLTATSSSNTDFVIGANPTHTISSTNGNITLSADEMHLNGATSISAGDTLSIFTVDPMTTIGLGSGTGILDLSSFELALLSAGNKIVIGEDGVQTGDMDVNAWNFSGTAFDVELYANDINLGGIDMGTGNIMAHAQDNGVDTGILTVDGYIDRDKTGTSLLDLRADHTVFIFSPGISSSTGSIDIFLNADRDGDEDGMVGIYSATITTNGGDFIAGGGSGDVGGADGILGNGDGTGADDLFAYAVGANQGIVLVDSTITTSGGDAIMHGYAKGTGTDDGISFLRSHLSSGDGWISLTGTSTGDLGHSNGVAIHGDAGGPNSTISSNNGNIDIYGESTDASAGFILWNETSITTNDGNITITGTDTSGDDIRLGGLGGTTPSHTISSTNGNITLNANDTRLTGTNTIFAGDTLSIFTIDPTTTIGLGDGATGILNLSNSELATLSAGNKIIIGKDGVQTGDMDVDAWNLSGTGFDLELYANDIHMGGIDMGTGNIMAHAQDNGVDTGILTVDGSISRTANGIATLDLRADQHVNIINAGVSISAIDSNSDLDGDPMTDADSLNVILNADRDGDEDGSISISTANITTLGGYFIAGGGAGDIGGANGIIGDGDGTGADDNFAYGLGSGQGVSPYLSQITTSGGDVIMNGYAKGTGTGQGIRLYDSEIDSGSGAIKLTGISTGDTILPRGVALYGDTVQASLTSTSGNIYISASSANDAAFALIHDTIITTTDGDITITAASPVGQDFYSGGTTPNHRISSTNGNITLNVDDANIENMTSISAGDTLSIFTIDPTTTIGLGDGSTGVLNLNDDELAILSAGNKIVIGKDGVQTGDMDVDVWDLSGKNFDLELYANDIHIGGVTMGTGDIMAHSQDDGGNLGVLFVDGNIDRDETGTSTLDLRADYYLDVNGATITSTTGAIDLILNADRDGDEDGRVSIFNTSTISTNGGYFVAGGGSGDVGGVNGILGDGDGTGADDIAAFAIGSGHGILFEDSQITTSGGDVFLHGNAKGAGTSHGIRVYQAGINSGDGKISLTGISTGDTDTPRGITLNGHSSPTMLQSAGGNITLTASATNSTALAFWEEAKVMTEDGSITITASSPSAGIYTGGTTTLGTISSTNGNVTLNVDKAAIQDMTSISAGNTLSIFTIDPTKTIGLGDGATGVLNLSDDELAILSAGNKIVIGKDGVQTGDMDINVWNLSGTSFDLELYANNINLGGVDMGTGNILAHAQDNGVDVGDLTVDGYIAHGVDGTALLDLRADQNIYITSANITASDADSDLDGDPATDTDSLNVILNADRDADEDGRIEITTANITTNGGYFVAGGGNGDVGGTNGILGDGDGTGADDSFAYGLGSDHGINTSALSLITSGGDTTMHGYSKGDGKGILMYKSGITSEDGSISLTGTSDSGRGLTLSGDDTTPVTISSTSGDIDLSGNAVDSTGLHFSGTSKIITTDGNITLTATAANYDDFNVGGTTPDHIISSANGNVTINLDDIAIQNMTSIYAGDTLSIFTIDPTTTIGLAGGVGDLNLSTIELSKLNAGNKIIIGKDGVQTGDMDVDLWNLSSTAFDLELYANDINLGGIDMGIGNIMAHAQDNGVDTGILTVDGYIDRDKTGTSLLDLRADKDLYITSANIDSDTGSINLILNADRDADEDGRIDINTSTITTNGGYFVAGGGGGNVGGIDGILGNGDGTGADDVAAFAVGGNHGVYMYDTHITTSDGDAILRGNAKGAGALRGIVMNISNISTGDGDISLEGTSTGDSGGILLLGNTSSTVASLTTAGGDIDLHGNSSGNVGISFSEDVSIITMDGNITLTGISPVSNGIAVGGTTPEHTISSTNGDIIINANVIALDDVTSIYAGNTLSIYTIDPTRTIGLGTGSTGLLNLNDTELSKLDAGNKVVIGKDGVQTGDMDVNAWNLSSTAFDLELYANDIALGGIDMGAGNILAHAQDNGVDLGVLTIDGNITRNIDGTSLLDLRADNDVISTAGVSITATDVDSDNDGDPATDADSLTVILNANRDGIIGDDEGGIHLTGLTIETLGGNIIMGGGNDPQNTSTYDSQAITLDSTEISSGAGDIYMTGTGNTGSNANGYGVSFANNSDIITRSGNIIISGTSQSTGTNSAGIYARTVKFTTDTGQIEMTGEAQGDNTDNNGIHGSSGFDISSTGTGASVGDIILNGTTAGDAAAIFIEGYRDITVYDADVTLSGINGDIILENPITKLGGTEETNVTLQADKGIYLDSDGDITSSSGIMNVVLNADRDGNEDGRIDIRNVSITTLGGYFVAGGGSGTLGGVDGILGNGDGTGADDNFSYGVDSGHGMAMLASEIRTSGGDVFLHGYAKGAGTNDGLVLNSTEIYSGTGDINLIGTSTGDTSIPLGVYFTSSTVPTIVESTSGHINIIGTSSTESGITFWEDASILTTDGNITLTAIAPSDNDLQASHSGGKSQIISSTNGNVTINADDIHVVTMTSISAGDTLSIQTLDDGTTIGLGNSATGMLNLNATELGILSAGNRIVIGNTDNVGAIHMNNVDLTGSDFFLYGGAMTVDGGLDADLISMISKGGITLNAAVSATEAGNSIIMVGTDFTNTTGLDSLDAGAGRYLIYMDDPSDVAKGGLAGGNYYNATYAGNPPASINAALGDRFVYAYQPTLTFTADDIDIRPTYDPTYSAFTYSISGLEPDDTTLGTYSGTPTFTSAEIAPGSGVFDISIAAGSLSSLIGYNFAFVDGTLTMAGTAPPIPPPPIPPSTGGGGSNGSGTPPPLPSAGQNGFTNSTNAGSWNTGVEQQIQVREVWLGYDDVISQNRNPAPETITHNRRTATNEWKSYSLFGNAEPRADVRLIEADYMEVEQPIVIFYDLCSYSLYYCGNE